MTRHISPERRLCAFVRRYDTVTAAAKALGISQAYLSQLLHGARAFSPAVLLKLGLERVPLFRSARAAQRRFPLATRPLDKL
jgi:transcriptional regulator with XRE-family HTH domain